MRRWRSDFSHFDTDDPDPDKPGSGSYWIRAIQHYLVDGALSRTLGNMGLFRPKAGSFLAKSRLPWLPWFPCIPVYSRVFRVFPCVPGAVPLEFPYCFWFGAGFSRRLLEYTGIPGIQGIHENTALRALER